MKHTGASKRAFEELDDNARDIVVHKKTRTTLPGNHTSKVSYHPVGSSASQHKSNSNIKKSIGYGTGNVSNVSSVVSHDSISKRTPEPAVRRSSNTSLANLQRKEIDRSKRLNTRPYTNSTKDHDKKIAGHQLAYSVASAGSVTGSYDTQNTRSFGRVDPERSRRIHIERIKARRAAERKKRVSLFLTASLMVLAMIVMLVLTVSFYISASGQDAKQTSFYALDGVEQNEEEVSYVSADIDKWFTVTLNFYGEEPKVYKTGDTTLEKLFANNSLSLGDSQESTVAVDEVLMNDTTVYIDTYSTETVVEAENIAYGTEYEDNSSMAKGTTSLKSSGQVGVEDVTYSVNYKNGSETSRTELSSTVITEPVNAVYYKGTAEKSINGYVYSYYIDVTATVYSGGVGTASGYPIGDDVIAVDPDVIPYFTKCYVVGSYGDFGVRVAADTGTAIVGNKIDVWLYKSDPLYSGFGVRKLRVYILE